MDILKAHTNFPGMICKLSSRNEVAKPSSRLHWIFERKSTIAIVFCTEIIAGGVKMLRQGELSYPARFTGVGIPNPARKGGNKLMIRGLLIQEHRTSGISHRCGSDTFC